MVNSYISGSGFNVPENVIKNNDFSKWMDTSDEWIQTRTGIKERRFVDKGIGPAELAVPAVEMALKQASLNISDIDFIIFATATPDYYVPGSGCLLQDLMQFNNIGALDIRVQCSGFVYALSIADQYIKSKMFKNILVVGSEVQSTTLDLSTQGRDVSVIFADGAGAVIVSRTDENKGIKSTHLHSEGKHAKELIIQSPSSKENPRISNKLINNKTFNLQMNGSEVFKHAIKRFPEVIKEALIENNLTIDDIDLIIPHQANHRITKFIQKKMNINEDKIVSNIHKYGNTTAASIPIALAESIHSKKINNGDHIILAAFGSGFTWASALIKW